MARTLTKENHDALLQAAIEIFREKEYGEVTVREIAARAGSYPSTFYRYFKTKEQLHEEILDVFLSRYLAAWGSIHPLFSDGIEDYESALEAMEAALRKIFEFYRDNRDIASVVFRRGASVDDRFAKKGQQVVDLTLAQMEKVAEALRSAGLGKDMEPKVGAVAMFGAVYGVAVVCVVHEKRDDIENLVRQVMGIIRAAQP
jgi:AcrR family transcriptional regulator